MECTSQEVIKCASIMFQILKYENICHWIHPMGEGDEHYGFYNGHHHYQCNLFCMRAIHIYLPPDMEIDLQLLILFCILFIDTVPSIDFFPLHIYSTHTRTHYFTSMIYDNSRFLHGKRHTYFSFWKSNCDCILFFRFTFYIPIHISMLFFFIHRKKTARILIN